MSKKSHYGGYSVDSLRLHICDEHPNFKIQPVELQRELSRLILINSTTTTYQHKIVDGAFYYHCDAKQQTFGRGNFKKISEGLIEIHEHWEKGIGYAYFLTPECKKIIGVWASEAANDDVLITPDNKIVKSPPTKSVLSRDCDGNNTVFVGNVSPIVQVNTKALKSVPALLSTLAANDVSYYTEERVERIKVASAGVLHLSVCSALPEGTIPQIYQQSGSGRLYGKGLNLQNCPRLVKEAALSGCWQYDLENAHLSALVQLLDIQLPKVEEYLKNKNKIRKELAGKYNVGINIIKQALISLVYGAPLSSSAMTSIGELLGNKAKDFVQDQFVSAFNRDLKIGREELIRKASKHCGRYINRVGKGILVKAKPAEIAAHLLQGAETQILHAMIESCGEDTALMQHDAIVTYHQQDIEKMEAIIELKTGFKMTLSESKLDFMKTAQNANRQSGVSS